MGLQVGYGTPSKLPKIHGCGPFQTLSKPPLQYPWTPIGLKLKYTADKWSLQNFSQSGVPTVPGSLGSWLFNSLKTPRFLNYGGGDPLFCRPWGPGPPLGIMVIVLRRELHHRADLRASIAIRSPLDRFWSSM